MRNMEEFSNSATIKVANAQHRISDMFLPKAKLLLLESVYLVQLGVAKSEIVRRIAPERTMFEMLESRRIRQFQRR